MLSFTYVPLMQMQSPGNVPCLLLVCKVSHKGSIPVTNHAHDRAITCDTARLWYEGGNPGLLEPGFSQGTSLAVTEDVLLGYVRNGAW